MSGTTIPVIAAASLVAILLLPAGHASPFIRQDVENGDYLVGFLAWSGGAGGIAWDGPSSGDGGPTEAAQDVYLSAPLPRLVHLNASRLVRVEIYCATPDGCQPALGAELYAGTELLGGILPGRTSYVTPGSPGSGANPANFPPDPPGYAVMRLGLAMEMSVLPKGTVLKLVITHAGAKVPRYGLSGDHASFVALPFFSDEEVPFRHPSYGHGAPGRSAGGSLGNVLGLGAALLLPFALVQRSVRSSTMLVIGLFMLASLGGCTGKRAGASVASDPGLVKGTLTPTYQEGNLSGKGLGSLIGQVAASDVGEPLVGAYALLVGTANATRTDPFGRFSFTNIPAGEYTLHIDHTGYESFEGTARVLPDLIARVDVFLVPLGSKEPGARPHVHDYWGLDPKRTLMDDVDLGRTPCYTAGSLGIFVGHCEVIDEFRIPPPSNALDYASVLPGTYEVNVTVDWDPATMGYATVGLLVQANNDPGRYNYTQFLPRGPGKTFRIATTWEMDDPGHQHFSTWSFGIYGGATVARDAQTTTLATPSYRVSVAVRKGVVPLEPAHRDFWGPNGTLDVMRDVPVLATQQSTPFLLDLPSQPHKAGYWWDSVWAPAALVPPGTKRLDVYANITNPPNPDYEIELRYKSAVDGPPTLSCWSVPGNYGQACHDGAEVYVPDGDGAGTRLHWSIDVDGNTSDPFYAFRSFWYFGLSPKRDPANVAALEANAPGGLFSSLGSYVGPAPTHKLTVVAHRDPDA